MHEWALAEAIIDAAVNVAAKENAGKITEIVIVLGELQTIDRDILETALNELKKETIASEAQIVFEDEKIGLKCNVCGFKWSIDDLGKILDESQVESVHFIPELIHVFIKCPKCGKSDFEITSGRGVYVKSIRVE